MTKGVDDQIEPINTRERVRKATRSRDMMSTLESRVVNLEEFVGYVRETLEVVEGRTDELDSMREQLREFVMESLGSNVEAILKQRKKDVPKLKEFKGTRSARDNIL
ncbi:hypothetical protein Goarm_010934 [Gossypium armourianum]|uniref:Uncharacterized protein n=1 Tax=Gossypium armourianum TaxID=34283 RepID=A0A7J9IV86_9ROSI|nr:hypothetical protein [Gossypium armourianum]